MLACTRLHFSVVTTSKQHRKLQAHSIAFTAPRHFTDSTSNMQNFQRSHYKHLCSDKIKSPFHPCKLRRSQLASAVPRIKALLGIYDFFNEDYNLMISYKFRKNFTWNNSIPLGIGRNSCVTQEGLKSLLWKRRTRCVTWTSYSHWCGWSLWHGGLGARCSNKFGRASKHCTVKRRLLCWWKHVPTVTFPFLVAGFAEPFVVQLKSPRIC